ncbi:hypothetical protein BCV69DRAFT_282542 [Microstroma glucosiphilum]|uniref:Fe2OG dioxygenase domain-containing protein n=1 Tax=Pseudomicrostroma glucosiphilum TaxID=1684307 RepID=A0A316U873_9BASI|nr:hypothetical protein BCV69DRAFT_282542 [Pseudomicrostroma glucosiphilum]PWN21038.1 hypothetical protein BCV69DRAFT_282542 [Pseudomicrostroma glucosiphilum]
MTAKRSLDSFFSSQGQGSSDHSAKDERSTDARKRPGSAKVVGARITQPNAASSVQSQWMPADERRQLELALKLSLGSVEASGVIKEELPPPSASVRERQRIPEELVSLSKPSATIAPSILTKALTAEESPSGKPSSDDSESKVAALQDPQPQAPPKRSLAPMFSSLPHSSKAAQGPQPTFDDTDFAPTDKVQVLNRFSGSLDCLFYPSWISSVPARKGLRDWMLSSLQWHRVCYTRPGTTFKINTPRFTTTFGMLTGPQAPPLTSYKIRPKEIPGPLRELKERIEAMQSTGGVDVTYNAAIVNFYATGEDSISYHADDEAFLGPEPNIASLSLGATRDFYLRRKQPEGVPVAPATSPSGSKGVGSAKDRPMEKLQLSEGALLIMRGKTQAEWEHSIPKRKGVKEGRINITFRKAIDRKAIDNFTRYNRGDGGGYRWNGSRMVEGTGGI